MSYESYIGEISLYAFNFAPKGEALCQGQILSIAQNTALFSLLGTYYGGNGQTTFGLPNLMGRVAVGMGSGPGLTPRTIGEMGGSETVSLTVAEMPMHNHFINASGDSGLDTPINNFIGAVTNSERETFNGFSGSPSGQMNPNAIGVAGGSQPHNNMQPFLVLNYSISLQGIYPSRG